MKTGLAAAAIAIGGFTPVEMAPMPEGFVQCLQDRLQACRETFVAEGWKRMFEGSNAALIADANDYFEVWTRGDKGMLCRTHYIRSVASSMLCLPLVPTH